jgi:hypothetical protein
MHQLCHRVVVDDRHLYRQMVRQYLDQKMMVNDKEILLVDVHLVHHLDENLVRQHLHRQDVLQNLDEQNLVVNLASVDVHLVDVVPVLNVVHLDELVWQVDVALQRLMKMDCYLHVVDVAEMLVKLELVLLALPQLV